MASSSLSTLSAPAFSSQSCKYHVFLSFRGEDTLNSFVDNLYSALEQQNIYTYKDDETLPRGESIDPSVMKAIEDSQIAVIVFSENYTDSSVCLDELAYIMKCKDKRGQIVLPIYYDVDPSAVRKQKQKYGTTFSKQELENIKKVESWRKALVDASYITGILMEAKSIAKGDESEFIKKIVDIISQRVQLVSSSANGNLIGIEGRIQDLIGVCGVGGDGVLMIGVCGVGGGGKTTLASSVCYEISSKFDGFCFVENIREESSKNGLGKLQEKILSCVLKQKKVQVGRVEEGRHMIMSRLCRKKVLIVLDDVDRVDQLQALAGSQDWFGEGSRIIITTRNQDLLKAHKVDVIHYISLLNNDEAIKLFCKHAHRNHIPAEDYKQLSNDVVSYADGLPLSLRVLGCFLCDSDMTEWRNALAKLKEIPYGDSLNKLRISFDGLEPVEKELFLDIACFFRREDKDKTIEMLDACGFDVVIGVKVLIQKALVTISEDGVFDMHDLVQEMGHYIVSGGHPKNPEKHSRVWKKEDVAKICAMDANTELDMIEAIKLKCNGADPFQRLPGIVANMKKLRWIDWEGDLACPLPTNFSPTELCCLKLDGSSQKQLWEGDKHLRNLRMMELNGMHNLMVTPDFVGLPNLEIFKLTGSWYLKEIHQSIGCLERLVFLSIQFCVGLKMFPSITQLRKLETLSFSRCPKLFKISEIPQNMNHIGLQFSHAGLRKLDLSYCELGDEDMVSVVWELPNLEKLDLTANSFIRLSFSRLQLPRLKWLNISYCERLVELSELPSSIAVLVADGCTSLDTFGDISDCKWLWNVSHRQGSKLGGDILLYSMLQGNAIEHYFISVTLEHQNPEGFVGRLFRGKTSTVHLPHNWFNDFMGFLICVVTNIKAPHINITIKQEVDEDSQFELWQEYNYEAVELEYDGISTSIGYVSFNSLRHTALLTSSYNNISLSIEDRFSGLNAGESYVGAELIPRKNRGDQVQATTCCSEFWVEEGAHGNKFMIEHDSKSNIKIEWFP